ncbi:hypothetical protein ACTND8_06145 [Atopobiaceae bacterium HCP3S3_F7]|uniref:hypothetical protein n=1 Tax=unclassified Collinsella TaxID=2637548 RepID=UPI003F917926
MASEYTTHAADKAGFTLRELDDFVAQATAAGVSWDSRVYVRNTRFPKSLGAPGVPFGQLSAAPDK